MKILVVAKHIYCKGHPRLAGCTTGLGTMLNHLLRETAKRETVIFLPCSVRIWKQFSTGQCVIARSVSLISLLQLKRVAALYKKNNIPLCRKCSMKNDIDRVLFLCIFAWYLKKAKPDVVHLHSLNEFTYLALQICEQDEQPLIVTGHNYFGEKFAQVPGYDEIKKYEKLILGRKGIMISLMSTGAKERALQDTDAQEGRIRVIYNGIHIEKKEKQYSVREKLGIGADQKVLLCIGTLSERKNQRQVVRAYCRLPENMKSRLHVLFLGEDADQGRLKQEIDRSGTERKLKYLGAVPVGEMEAYYAEADGIITASRMEGFSMVLLEGFAHGLPAVMAAELDTNADLADSKIGCIARDTTDHALCDAIRKWYDTQWDRDYIKQYVQKYDWGRIAESYLDYCRDVLPTACGFAGKEGDL